MKVYAVRHWERDFEISQSRKARTISWVAIPNKHDGKGFRRLSRHQNAPALFCAFVLILEVASKMPTRGTLFDEDGPLGPDDLADMTGYPEAIFAEALEVLTDPAYKIGWLKVLDETEAGPLVACSEPAGSTVELRDGTVQDKTVRTERDKRAPASGVSQEGEAPEGEPIGFAVLLEAQKALAACPCLSDFPLARLQDIAKRYPTADLVATCTEAAAKAGMYPDGLREPGSWLFGFFRKESENASPRPAGGSKKGLSVWELKCKLEALEAEKNRLDLVGESSTPAFSQVKADILETKRRIREAG